jgi:hypothetical protein
MNGNGTETNVGRPGENIHGKHVSEIDRNDEL